MRVKSPRRRLNDCIKAPKKGVKKAFFYKIIKKALKKGLLTGNP